MKTELYSCDVSWQRDFTSSILSIAPELQIIFATHSAEIVGRYREKCIPLFERKAGNLYMNNINDIIPQHSTEAYMAFPILYDALDDVIVYIEDAAGVHIYETILYRLLGDTLKVTNVHAVNGKRNLINLYKRSKSDYSEATKKACFYIADLDFDTILENNMVTDKNFIYLERYSIENYLVDENAGASIINSRTNQGIESCKRNLNILNWLEKISICYKKLLTIFMVVQKLDIDVSNTGLKAAYFTNDNSSYFLDELKIRKYIKETVYCEYLESKKWASLAYI